MGSTGIAAVRWLTGHWLPSWGYLASNPVFQGYVILSAFIGAALTFWFDDRKNPKLNTLILVRVLLFNLFQLLLILVGLCVF